MKRVYQTPTTHCVTIESEQFIALSTGGTTDEISGNLSREMEIPGLDFAPLSDNEWLFGQ